MDSLDEADSKGTSEQDRVSLANHDSAVCGYIPVVLFKSVRETMMTVAIGDEIKIVGRRGMHGRFERSLSRVGDRPRRESGMSVSVVSRLILHVGMMQCACINSLQ